MEHREVSTTGPEEHGARGGDLSVQVIEDGLELLKGVDVRYEVLKLWKWTGFPDVLIYDTKTEEVTEEASHVSDSARNGRLLRRPGVKPL